MYESSCRPPDEPRRCPRLGGPVGFDYCLQAGEGRPCFKVLDCWWEIFDVTEYLRQTMGENELAALAASRPQPKAASLVEIIRQARQRLENEPGPGGPGSSGKVDPGNPGGQS